MQAVLKAFLALALAVLCVPALALTNGDLFTWASANYPGVFSGTPVGGRYEQYDYMYYPSGNYLAVDDLDDVYVLGPVSGNNIMYVGNAATFAPTVLAWQATQPRTAYRGEVLISAWNADGSVASIQDFVAFTRYVINRWSMYQNYGAYPIGKPPAGAQIGSDIAPQNVDGTNYIRIDVPKNQPFYFTALWKAAVIGTVFMRADAQGDGYLITGSQPQKLELPYDFARSEFQQALRQATGATLTPQAQGLLAQATAAINAADSAATGSARALASYTALESIMPLKEQLLIDASNKAILAAGQRSDFELNYEGFQSWTYDTTLPGYTAAKEAGFKSVYTVVDWPHISPSPDVYDFSSLDRAIQRALALGFKIGININRNKAAMPAWAANYSFEQRKKLYRQLAKMVVARYGSQVSTYYPAGEMELQIDGLTLAQAAELANQSLEGAREAAPGVPFGYYVSASAYVGYQMNAGPTADYLSGLDVIKYMVRNGTHFDFIGLQMQYGTTFAPIDLQRFQEVVLDVHKLAKVPIYMGETGASSMTEDYGIPAQFHWRGGLTRQSQYEWADGTLRSLYALPFVKAYYWVHLDPDNNDNGSDYLSTLVGTGFVSGTDAVKKVQTAFKDFMAQVTAMPLQ